MLLGNAFQKAGHMNNFLVESSILNYDLNCIQLLELPQIFSEFNPMTIEKKKKKTCLTKNYNAKLAQIVQIPPVPIILRVPEESTM